MSPPPIQIFPFEVHCNHFSTKNTLFSSDIVSVFFLNLVFYTVKKLFFSKFRRLHNFKYGLILTLWCQLWTRTGAFPAFAEFELGSILQSPSDSPYLHWILVLYPHVGNILMNDINLQSLCLLYIIWHLLTLCFMEFIKMLIKFYIFSVQHHHVCFCRGS